MNILINLSLSNMSASARTDADSLVTVAMLESIETVLKSLRGHGFPIESKVAESLLVTIDDLLNNKVRGVVSGWLGVASWLMMCYRRSVKRKTERAGLCLQETQRKLRGFY